MARNAIRRRKLLAAKFGGVTPRRILAYLPRRFGDIDQRALGLAPPRPFTLCPTGRSSNCQRSSHDRILPRCRR